MRSGRESPVNVVVARRLLRLNLGDCFTCSTSSPQCHWYWTDSAKRLLPNPVDPPRQTARYRSSLSARYPSTMGLNIKNEHTTALVRELAKRTGLTQTGAIAEAVRAKLAELDRARVGT